MDPSFSMSAFRRDVAARLDADQDQEEKPKPPTKPTPPPFPGAGWFRPGAKNIHVTALGKQLVARGYGRYYSQGPGPSWTNSDRTAVRAYQTAQGWKGADADGYPGPSTWSRLFS
ncbi:peptidoglycan-binding protein [Streptomyces sp. NBC_00237]|uniref:peptidoglycan-binding protein n=1 Tax=Streptomyces sp. NBC_00237 TaxID=2975687 RepID=UPI002B1DA415|nr:peptidoglycan-binding protein [Streptomyces sp. NBC_00237]